MKKAFYNVFFVCCLAVLLPQMGFGQADSNKSIKIAPFISGGENTFIYKGIYFFKFLDKQINKATAGIETSSTSSSYSNFKNSVGYNFGGGIELKRAGNHYFSHILELNYTAASGQVTHDSSWEFVSNHAQSSQGENIVENMQYALNDFSFHYLCQFGYKYIFAAVGTGIDLNTVKITEQGTTLNWYEESGPPWEPYSYTSFNGTFSSNKNASYVSVPVIANIGGMIRIKTIGIKLRTFIKIYPTEGYNFEGVVIDVSYIPAKFY